MKNSHEIDGWFNYEDLFENLVNKIPDNGIFVEGGAWLGKSSSYLCDLAKDRINVYIVDAWNYSKKEMEISYPLAKEMDIYQIFLENMGDRKFTQIRKESIEASKDFEDESCDVVFIDMDHSYEAVKQDLMHWFPKVKRGGYIAGHDVDWEGVSRAINEFFPKEKLKKVSQSCWIFYKE
jgi:predicted O-methyltransferase YrrM